MKAEFEDCDIEAIANRVAEFLKPHLSKNRHQEEDKIFNVKELAEYLKMDVSWVYKQVSKKTIPYFKPGKYNLFRKSEIDKWIAEYTIKPVPQLSLLRNRG